MSGKCDPENGSGSSAGSGVSGYESDVAGDSGWKLRQSLECPECGKLNKLPVGGLTALPPHYVLQHRMLLASLNQESVCFFCDLCSTDVLVGMFSNGYSILYSIPRPVGLI